jgi:hypothetical protein
MKYSDTEAVYTISCGADGQDVISGSILCESENVDGSVDVQIVFLRVAPHVAPCAAVVVAPATVGAAVVVAVVVVFNKD